MKKLVFASLALATLLSSCEETEPKVDISYEKALMNRKWQVVKVQQNANVNEPTNVWHDITNSTDPCISDNRLTFISKTDAQLDEHYRKCTESDPQTRDYGYVLENENYIKIFSNRADINGTTWRGGAFKWSDSITRFTIDERKANPATPTVLVSTIYTYQNVPN